MPNQNERPSLPALAKQQVGIVENRVKQLQEAGQLDLPKDYSPSNALRSAFLVLQEVKDRQNKPALEVCTQASITNSLLDMITQGLSPAKKQCYFIVFGNQLVCMRSYHGSKAVAKMVDPRIGDIVAEVVWEGDEFEYEIERGQKRIVKHKQTLESIDSKKPRGAYCEVLDHKGNVLKTDIMTFEQIKQAWKKSPSKPILDNGNIKESAVHSEFTEEMLKKTVVNRCCKPIINSSSDRQLLSAANRTEQIQEEEEAEREIQAQANQEIIDIQGPQPEPSEHMEGEGANTEFDPDQDIQQEENREREIETTEADPGF